ncbi:MAG TPA: peptide synthetase, partial [Paracoccus sp.]|nr:peptide synthetase [Paracoccus sp. (in: a-proteobacteria)]
MKIGREFVMSTSALFIGNESLLVQCAEHWLGRGLTITAVATRNPDIARWAEGRGIPLRAQAELRSPEGLDYDWLLSVANLSIIPQPLLDGARRGAVNFHDGPLPRHAGLNAPAWAILGAEPRHGITWHMIEGGIDEGDILVSREFEIAPDDTTLTLNARAWEAAVDSFPELAEALVAGSPARRPQDLSQRSYHPRDKRPPAAGRLGFDRPAQDVARLVRALDHGDFANPLAL